MHLLFAQLLGNGQRELVEGLGCNWRIRVLGAQAAQFADFGVGRLEADVRDRTDVRFEHFDDGHPPAAGFALIRAREDLHLHALLEDRSCHLHGFLGRQADVHKWIFHHLGHAATMRVRRKAELIN